MFRALRELAGQILSKAPDGYAVRFRRLGPDPAKEKLEFAALAEAGRIAGQPKPNLHDPLATRRSPAEEKKRIEDRPIP